MAEDLVLPSEIPWSEIKGADLEELLYWLFDSMGAKDLEWRRGGTGGGAPDQGRDLELAFFVPSPDGTLAKQTWWVEAKGRTGTVDSNEVHRAVHNAAGKSNVDVLVIATNSVFSNPTRDWVKNWQQDHPRPIIKLWEKTQLENLCSKNPLAVIRLHSHALSPQGKVQVLRSKLWDYASFSDEPTLRDIWKKRDEVDIDERALFALVASEIANGDIGARSWALAAPDHILLSTLGDGLVNSLFLAFRTAETGVRQEPLFRTISYLIIVAAHRLGQESVISILTSVWDEVEGIDFPSPVREMILDPVLATLQAELKDVCVKDCRRVSTKPEILTESEIETYWDRLSPESKKSKDDNRILTIENLKEPCKVGFPVDKDVSCPLAHGEKLPADLNNFVRIVDQVIKFRNSHKDTE